MTLQTMPETKGLQPQLIGEVVLIQIFQRESPKSDELNTESMKQYAGVLERYSRYKNVVTFALVGGKDHTIVLNNQTIEIFSLAEVSVERDEYHG